MNLGSLGFVEHGINKLLLGAKFESGQNWAQRAGETQLTRGFWLIVASCRQNE
jgi:hypothetical protein